MQWFFVSRDDKNKFSPVDQAEVSRLLQLVRDQHSNVTALSSLARFLGASLEPRAYDLFIEEIGPLVIEIFYEDSVENADGFPDDARTKDLHYRKYCLFKFASFLELLCPYTVHWRGQTDLEGMTFISQGLDRFQSAGLAARTSMLSSWIQQPGPSAFSEKRTVGSRRVMERRAVLLKMEKLSAKEVAKEFDDRRFKTRKYPTYTAWFAVNPTSFQAWLSKERKKSRETWDRVIRNSPKRQS